MKMIDFYVYQKISIMFITYHIPKLHCNPDPIQIMVVVVGTEMKILLCLGPLASKCQRFILLTLILL